MVRVKVDEGANASRVSVSAPAW